MNDLNYEDILDRANQIYFDSKLNKMNDRETLHADKEDIKIKSDQVKAILLALVETINKNQQSRIPQTHDVFELFKK